MKTKFLALMLAIASLESWAQTPPGLPAGLPTATPPTRRLPRYDTNSAATRQPRYIAPGAAENNNSSVPALGNINVPGQDEMAPMINFQGVEVNQVLEIDRKSVV